MRVKIKRRLIPMLLLLIIILTSSVPAFAADPHRIIFSGEMAGTSGTKVYYAFGEFGGPLYKYDVKTHSKKKIAAGHWRWLNQKGKYLYAAQDKIAVDDASDFYIYRIRKNGKGKRKLAAGICPVVKGKYIYYIKMKKIKEGNTVEDSGRRLGVYRMKLNGKGKKCLVKASSNSYFNCLGVTSKGLVYKNNDDWYQCSLKGKNIKKLDKLDFTSNMSIKKNYSEEYSTEFAVVDSKYAYFPANNKIIRNGYDDGKTLASFAGNLKKIIVSGKQLMIISETAYGETSYVYIMNANGKHKRRVLKKKDLCGLWDYL